MTGTLLRALALPLALAALACAAPGPQAEPIAPGHGRIVVAPLNLGIAAPAEVAGAGAPVWDELLRYLRRLDRPLAVLDAPGSGRLWGSARAELERSGARVDPRSTASRFAELLAAQVDYGVLVMPSLVVRKARIGGQRATWDGVSRDLPLRSAAPLTRIEDALPGVRVDGYRGSIAAASLYVAILAADGEPLYEGLAGLDVIQEVASVAQPHGGPAWSLEPRRDSFADAAGLREGIELAFERKLPSP
jgi:hypothetical protein